MKISISDRLIIIAGYASWSFDFMAMKQVVILGEGW